MSMYGKRSRSSSGNMIVESDTKRYGVDLWDFEAVYNIVTALAMRFI